MVSQNNDMNGPVFVVSGLSRCGTTLLRLMLTAHSKISIPPESLFIRRLLQYGFDADSVINNSNRQEFINIVWDEGDTKLSEWQLDRKDVEQSLQGKGDITLADAIAEIYWAYADKKHRDAEIWGDKNPSYLWDIDALRRLFPASRFIVIIRDIRDVYLSMYKLNPDNCWNIKNIAYAWNEIIEMKETCIANDHVTFVKYEELLENPEHELMHLCGFLDIKFETSMLEYHSINKEKELVPKSRVDWGHENTLLPVIKDNFNKWSRELAPERVEVIEYFAARQMDEMRYQRAFSGNMLSLKAKMLLLKNYWNLAKLKLVRDSGR